MEPDIPFGVTLLNDGIFAAGILLVVAVAILVGLDQRLVGAGKVGWILAVVFLPVLGAVAYLVVAGASRSRKPRPDTGEAVRPR